MTESAWRRVDRLRVGDEGSFAVLDKLAEDSRAPCLWFRSDDRIALALDPGELGLIPEDRLPATDWILVLNVELESNQLEGLLRIVRADLPPGHELSRAAYLRSGASKPRGGRISVPGTNIQLELVPVPDLKPELGTDTEARKLPEGRLGGRESWFRGRTGGRDKD